MTTRVTLENVTLQISLHFRSHAVSARRLRERLRVRETVQLGAWHLERGKLQDGTAWDDVIASISIIGRERVASTQQHLQTFAAQTEAPAARSACDRPARGGPAAPRRRADAEEITRDGAFWWPTTAATAITRNARRSFRRSLRIPSITNSPATIHSRRRLRGRR